MARVHYFPRYKGGENSVTNTVLHLFEQIYGYSPYPLNTILSNLLDIEIPLGLSIEQQKGGKGSIPDGIISQEAFTILIETKTGSPVSISQLKRHCATFHAGERYLLVITDNPNNERNVKKLNIEIDYVHIVHCTFNKLSKVVSDEFHDYETQIKPIVDDFFAFCTERGLIPPEGVLRAVPCGASFALNVKHLCYRNPAKRNYTAHTYLGLYTEKSVQMIGKIEKVVVVTEENGELQFDPQKTTPEIENRIRAMITDTKEQLGWGIDKEGVRFFCVDKFFKTDYKKTSKGGMQINRYFDISDTLKDAKSLQEVAEKLSKETWE